MSACVVCGTEMVRQGIVEVCRPCTDELAKFDYESNRPLGLFKKWQDDRQAEIARLEAAARARAQENEQVRIKMTEMAAEAAK